MTYDKSKDRCKNCGHVKQIHKSLGGITICEALITRYPQNKFCDCKEFKGD